MSDPLAALAAQVRADLAKTAHPRMPWLTAVEGPDGQPALDVLIVGAGQSGLAIAFALRRSEVTNILVLDKADEGREGPWLTYARMPTLRSPKDYTGPDLDMPSLTYQAWHETKFGDASWRELDLIPREYLADYLLWYRRVLELPVRNGCEVTDIAPVANGLLQVTIRGAQGEGALYARKVVLATGQEGMGDWSVPEPLGHLPASRCVNCSAPIDFEALRGKRVAVIGAGASAFDNAAMALESGASTVHLLCRRAAIQLVQPYRWLTFRGFLRHLSDLDDAWRWRFMRAVLEMREGFPQTTYDRCARHTGFHLQEGAPVEAARETANGILLRTPRGEIATDFVICTTGIEMDLAGRAELRRFAHNIARWSDRYTPPPTEQSPRLGAFPYLADDYAFAERAPGQTPWIADIHLFAIASTMSFGPSGSSINAMTTAVPKLVHGLTRGLFRADIDKHWAAFNAYDVPQAVIRRAK
jgi:FAD-dependent urate hydroxylase